MARTSGRSWSSGPVRPLVPSGTYSRARRNLAPRFLACERSSAVKATAFYQLTLCAAVVATSPVVTARPASPRAHAIGNGQQHQATAERERAKRPESKHGEHQRAGERSRGGIAGRSSNSSRAKPSQIPAAVAPIRHKVMAGETLGEIAQRAGTTVEVLAATNRLGKGQPLRVGQLLVLPSVAKSPRKSWHVYARPPKKPGYLEVSTHAARFNGQALGSDGRLNAETVRALNNVLGAGGSRPAMPERLVRLLIEVSDTFGGRPIRLVSGYRTTSYFQDSRHKLSSAIDFLVVGVPNAVVCEYLREIEDVGVGYYPNSSFVHLDVRDHSAYWVDYAGPGEPPRSTPHRPAVPAKRPMRGAERQLVAALDRALEETKRGLEKAAGRAAPTPPAAAEPGLSSAFDQIAMSAARRDATAASKVSEP